MRLPLHFHPTLDLCAFVYAGEDGEEEEDRDAILRGTDPLACRDVVAGEPLEEGEVSGVWILMVVD